MDRFYGVSLVQEFYTSFANLPYFGKVHSVDLMFSLSLFVVFGYLSV